MDELQLQTRIYTVMLGKLVGGKGYSGGQEKD